MATATPTSGALAVTTAATSGLLAVSTAARSLASATATSPMAADRRRPPCGPAVGQGSWSGS
ncbi:hypothetical protein [Mycobacterium sp. PSTR-4-N]|uniref:hypothetical protein n=1 Tax=Mycobacterium sp. PSTR-4-N TaxID=2917745 RepID=UPI001F15663B|nr:hypothetical protein [Mycobacterium sp. PSTR-4-N]MCG7594179.1 hypothetical protein [Mycobacterium sp. PSTR-4-N]